MKRVTRDTTFEGTTSFEVARIEGIDWVCDTYLRPNLGFEQAVKQFGSADDHVVEIYIRDCAGKQEAFYCTLTVREFQEFADHISFWANFYDDKTERHESDVIKATHPVPQQHPGMVQE